MSDLYRIKLYTVDDGENHTIYYEKAKQEDWPEILKRLEVRFGKNQLRGIRRVRDLVEERNKIRAL